MTAVSCSRITWASPFILARLLVTVMMPFSAARDADWVSFLEHAADCSCSHALRVYGKESFVTRRGPKVCARLFEKGEKMLCFNLQKFCVMYVRGHIMAMKSTRALMEITAMV